MFLCGGIIETWLRSEADISQIRAKVLPLDMTCLHCVLQTELLDFLNFWNGLPHLAVLTFPVRAATKLSTWQRWKKNALCVVPSRCIRVTCCPFRAIRKLLRSAISIRTDRHRFCPSVLPITQKHYHHHPCRKLYRICLQKIIVVHLVRFSTSKKKKKTFTIVFIKSHQRTLSYVSYISSLPWHITFFNIDLTIILTIMPRSPKSCHLSSTLNQLLIPPCILISCTAYHPSWCNM